MTPIWTLVLLGIVQGLTEFLPVSSSGHLVIIQSILPGFNEPGVLFHATVHLGTLGAVLLYFRQDLLDMASCFISPRTADRAGSRAPFATVPPSRPLRLAIQWFRHGPTFRPPRLVKR